MKTKILLILPFLLILSVTGIEDAHFNLAKKYYEENKFELASREFEEFCNKYFASESYNKALYYGGKSFQQVKNYKKAIKFFETLAKNANREYEKRQSSFELARCYYLLKDYKKSALLFKEFFIKYPDSPVSHAALYYSATSYDRIGKKPEAIILYENLLSNYPESKYASVAKKIIDEFYSLKSEKVKKFEIVVITNEVFLTNHTVQTNIYIVTNFVEQKSLFYSEITDTNKNIQISSQNLITNTTEEDPLLKAIKEENLKNEEEIKRYQEIMELRNKLLQIKEKLLKEKKELELKDEEEEE
jgi:tetratricopeptide (TPR) repeat protein